MATTPKMTMVNIQPSPKVKNLTATWSFDDIGSHRMNIDTQIGEYLYRGEIPEGWIYKALSGQEWQNARIKINEQVEVGLGEDQIDHMLEVLERLPVFVHGSPEIVKNWVGRKGALTDDEAIMLRLDDDSYYDSVVREHGIYEALSKEIAKEMDAELLADLLKLAGDSKLALPVIKRPNTKPIRKTKWKSW